MDKNVGIIIIVAVTLIVGAILFQVIEQEVGLATSTRTLENVSMAAAAEDNVAQYWTGYRSLTGVNIFNATGDVEIPDDNYTITNNVIDPTTGGLSVNITPQAPAPELGYDVGLWTVDATGQETDYIDDAGARAVAGLIGIFFALAIAVVALTPVLREKLLGAIGR